MRLLVTIPHYFRRTEQGASFYGSESGALETRAAMVARTITALQQTFGPRQALFGPDLAPCNHAAAAQLDIVLITSGNQHLVENLPTHLFHHYQTRRNPRHLGFVCHEFLREHAGRYDHYAYLEDDLEITDPLFFQKLRWFAARFGPTAFLQPNRFEQATNLNVLKLYVDGQMIEPHHARQHQDTSVDPVLEAEAFGAPIRFQRVDNVHAGCFILDDAQLARLAATPAFANPTDAFCGPLESAATLPLMQAFNVYKPARENAGFLELRHLGHRFLTVTGPAPTPMTDPATDPAPQPTTDPATNPANAPP